MSGKEKISEQLSAYLDGELSPEESRRMAEMVADDSALSAELESLRAVQSLLRNLPHAQAPDGMSDAVLARAQRRNAGWWAGRLARAAIILLVVGVGVTVTTWMSRTHRPVIEPQDSVVARTPVLADGKVAGPGGPALAGVTNVLFINTPAPDLARTQQQVESVFGRNSIKPMVAEDTVRLTKGAPESRSRGNFFNQTQVAPNQIRYELAITENQMRHIVSELNEIRARQNVAQIPMKYGHMKDGGAIALAKADFQDKSAVGGTSRGDAVRRKARDDKKRAGEKARLGRDTTNGLVVAGKAKTHEEAASQPALAAGTPSPGTARSRPVMAKPSGPTTMPASTVVAQQKVDEIRQQRAVHRQATTLATANVRQLVVILNVVGGE